MPDDILMFSFYKLQSDMSIPKAIEYAPAFIHYICTKDAPAAGKAPHKIHLFMYFYAQKAVVYAIETLGLCHGEAMVEPRLIIMFQLAARQQLFLRMGMPIEKIEILQ